jgi:Icc-related predicted phosphoesterase
MKILAIGDPHGKIPKIPRDIDLILINGDLGKSDLARSLYLFKGKITKKKDKEAHDEIYFSTINLLESLSKKSEVYTIMGNVAQNWDKLLKRIGKIKRVHVVKNSLRNISGIRVGFLEYFTDLCWVKEFNEKSKKKIRRARKGTKKAERVLRRFGKLDILVCHQPPYGILDKVGKNAPNGWHGKHAGSKIILNYIKKYQPRYVLCGHIHEGKGKRKLGKTKIYNLGLAGKLILNVESS